MNSMDYFIRIAAGFSVLVGVVFIAVFVSGFVITKRMSDGTEQYSGVAAAAARNALQQVYMFIDAPIERAYTLKYKVISLELKSPPPQVPPRSSRPFRGDSSSFPALESGTNPVIQKDGTGAAGPIYRAKVRTYTFFAKPLSTISVDTENGGSVGR